MVQKRGRGRPKRNIPSERLYVRVDSELLQRFTHSLGKGWRKERQKIIESLLADWLRNSLIESAELLPRYASPEEREDEINNRFFSNSPSRIIERKVESYLEGWLIEEKITRIKEPTITEPTPRRVYELLRLRGIESDMTEVNDLRTMAAQARSMGREDEAKGYDEKALVITNKISLRMEKTALRKSFGSKSPPTKEDFDFVNGKRKLGSPPPKGWEGGTKKKKGS